jgi:hypothetical protein
MSTRAPEADALALRGIEIGLEIECHCIECCRKKLLGCVHGFHLRLQIADVQVKGLHNFESHDSRRADINTQTLIVIDRVEVAECSAADERSVDGYCNC